MSVSAIKRPKVVLASRLVLRIVCNGGLAFDTEMEDAASITCLPTPSAPSLTFPDSYDEYRDQGTPLIIDNGSTNLRFGFFTSITPHSGWNAIAKYKERKSNKPLLLFGEGIDSESGAKTQVRTPWEGDVLLNFDALVCRVPLSRSIGT